MIVAFAAIVSASLSIAQREAAPASIPAGRQADTVGVITISGAIDGVTSHSVRRRIDALTNAGVGALVFELDTPGGEVGAVLEITDAIKGGSIANTVAWVRPQAYSGGAIIALACREIVASDPAAMGDAFPVMFSGQGGRMGLRGLSADERTKLLPVLMAEVTDSARRNGYDEYIVQAIVIDQVELWLVEDGQAGRRIAINEEEYRLLFDGEPIRGKPLLAGVTGGRQSRPGALDRDAQPDERTPDEQAQDERAPEDQAPTASGPSGPDGPGGGDEPPQQPVPETPDDDAEQPGDDFLPPQDTTPGVARFKPASPALDDVAAEFSNVERTELELKVDSERPSILPGDRGRYRLVGYLTDGSAPVVLANDQLDMVGFTTRTVGTDEELMLFFGATNLMRMHESWSEALVRFMTLLPVRGVLIVLLIVGLVIESLTPGTGVFAGIALLAVIGLVAPPMLIGLAGWWEVLAILAGLGLIAVEVFVLPGFGVFGAVGLLALFAGLVGTFIPNGPAVPGSSYSDELFRGAVTVVLSAATAFVVTYIIAKNFGTLPILGRLVLTETSGESQEESIYAAMTVEPEMVVSPGDEGYAATDLRPSGSAEFDGELVDVVAELGYVERGERVRVVSADSFQVIVQRIDAADGRGANS